MNNQLTILVPTSPIPSHPSTAILNETVSNIRKYTNARIIIMADGVHKSLEIRKEAYQEYLKIVQMKIDAGNYGDCIMRVFSEHSHQSLMTKSVLADLVSTPLVMFCEADTSPIGDIPFQEICDAVQSSDTINCLRFNIFEQIPKEHEYLMLGLSDLNGIRITRTIQFSARPHIAKTDWYKEVMGNYFEPYAKSMIEDILHGVIIESYKEHNRDIFGLAIYTPEGNQLRSYHADGRGKDNKIIYG